MSFGLRSGPLRAARGAEVPVERADGEAFAIRTARKDGREVVTLRCFEESADAVVIECEVYPISKMVIEPLKPGPYRFGSLREASAFIDETALALKYLGCDVA